MLPLEFIKSEARKLEIDLSAEALGKMDIYASELVEWSEKINLTAIKEPDEMAVKHYIDSLTILSALELKQGAGVIDIGTGAGFPGLVLKIARPDIELTLLDSLNKRILYLNDVLSKLQIGATTIHGRAEEKGKTPELREKFDLAAARAVASLSALAEYCLPFVKVGGIFAAMKGPDVEAELQLAIPAIEMLGGEVSGVKHITLPDYSGRSIVIIKKISHTPTEYPRQGTKITKKPLGIVV